MPGHHPEMPELVNQVFANSHLFDKEAWTQQPASYLPQAPAPLAQRDRRGSYSIEGSHNTQRTEETMLRL